MLQPGDTKMKTIPDRANVMALSALLTISQALELGLGPDQTSDLLIEIMKQELTAFRDEILESQREAAEALGAALRMAGK